MERGKRVYPYEDIPDIYEEIAAENQAVIFSEKTYRKMSENIRKLDMTGEEKSLLFRYLADRGIRSLPDKEVFSEERVRQINEIYTPQYADQLIRVTSKMRPMLHLTPKIEE